MHSGDLVTCAWHDTKSVHFLGTVHNEFTVDIRHKGSEGGWKTVEKLAMAKRYNEDMAGIDKIDQLLQLQVTIIHTYPKVVTDNYLQQ